MPRLGLIEGMRMIGRALIVLVAMMLWASSGCGMGESSQKTTIAKRHGAEFGCAPDAVDVTTVDRHWGTSQGTFAASGCGTRSIYVCDKRVCVRDSGQRQTSGGEQQGTR